MNIVLYISTVLIWGTTWLAIAFQVDEVAVEVSVFYRFSLAAVLQVGLMCSFGRLKWIPISQHKWIAAQGLLLFSVNFILFYNAAVYLTSGLISVIFSMATIFNMLNGIIFHQKLPEIKSLLVVFIGLVGICLIFWPDLNGEDWLSDIVLGLLLAMGGTYCFSLGNLVSQHQQKQGRDVLTVNSYSLVYGAIGLGVWNVINGYHFDLEYTSKYLGSLFYLASVGTLIGFGAYLLLVVRIGTEKSAYATVLFPIVALTLSTIYEDYVWTQMSVAGVAMALLGNIVIFSKFPLRKKQLLQAQPAAK
jgi:drug/metabolite transporter (DMT)-like permease